MPTKPQNSSREMVLPAYKAAISPGPPTSHTTPSNSANPRSAKQITHPTNQIRDTSLPATSFGGTRDAKQDIRATSLPAACPPLRLAGSSGGRQATSNKTRATTCEIRYTGDVRRICPLHLSRILYKFAPFMQNKPNFLIAKMNATLSPTKDYEK